MKCKGNTVVGDRCRNPASEGSDYCYLHDPEYSRDINRDRLLYCSFCGKSQHQVVKLIAGPSVFICDECTDLCVEIILDESEAKQNGSLLPGTKALFGGTKNKKVSLEELGFKPRFNTLKFNKKDGHCFFLCPFTEPFNSIYADHVKPLVETEGFSIERADEIYGTQPIIEDIWESINCAEFIIADVTGKNPNVMYEIGMAHTVGKPVLIMTQNIDDVPFDLKHFRCIIYSFTPKGVEAMQDQIAGTLRFMKD